MLKAVTNDSLNCINAITEFMLQNTDQVQIKIDQDLCGNFYARHCLVPKDVVIVGALLKVPTAIIIDGDCIVYDGKETRRITGYKIIAGQAYRQSIFRAIEPTHITMLAMVNSTNLEDVQRQLTDQHMLLTNHRQELLKCLQ